MNDPDFYPEFIEFIDALNKSSVKYIIIGGYSVIFHGYVRSTMDMDVWIERTQENYKKLVKAFTLFQMPTFDMTEENFLHNNNMDVFTFGRPPVSIDLLNQVKGLEFDSAYSGIVEQEFQGVLVKFIGKNDLIKAKKAAGRNKDLDDLEHLQNES